MLGSPCLLFPLSSRAPKEIDFVNDVRVVARARLEGPDNFILFVLTESLLWTLSVCMLFISDIPLQKIHLLVQVFYCVFIFSEGVLKNYHEKLWHQIFTWPQNSFIDASQKKELCLHRKWQGECRDALPGIHWPRSALKYRDGECIHVIFVADQAHRYMSVFWFGLFGVVSFVLLAPITAVLYNVCMGALFLFQQEGLRIYPKSPRLYHFLDLAFKGGALFAALFYPELLCFTSRFTQVLFIAFVGHDALYSLPKLLFGEGCSLKFGRT